MENKLYVPRQFGVVKFYAIFIQAQYDFPHLSCN